MPAVGFVHDKAGSLLVENGIDQASWGYNLNIQTFPTYGGEVVQVLSVLIEDLTLTGTISTYAQLEAIYGYFGKYLIAASQGQAGVNQNAVTQGLAYNLSPMTFVYPERNWNFQIYPKSAPGFRLDLETAAPQWQLVAHVIDDSPDLKVIKDGISGAAVKSLSSALPNQGANQANFTLDGQISPKYDNPNTDPFETFDPSALDQQSSVLKYADYYNSLVQNYMGADFAALSGVVGSQPSFGATSQNNQPNQQTVTVTPPNKKKSNGKK